MRRKQGQLVPFERQIIDVIGEGEMHGVAIAQALAMDRTHGLGSLYKALHRLESFGDLKSRLEDAGAAERARRPRRRLYRRRAAQRGEGRE